MRRDCVELALHLSELEVRNMEDCTPCNLSILADETTFYCFRSVYAEGVAGVTYTHLLTRLRAGEAHSIEPCISKPREYSCLSMR